MKSDKPNEIIELEKFYKISLSKIDEYDDIQNHIRSYKIDRNDKIIELNLDSSKLRTIKKLKNLKSLRKLYLNNNNIENIDTLKGFVNLEYLYIGDNNVVDISVLKSLSRLSHVDLINNNIYDLSPLYDHFKKKDFILTAWENPLVYPSEEIMMMKDNEDIVNWFDTLWKKAALKIIDNLEKEDTTLDLGNCGLTDLSRIPLLFDCKHLKCLILSNEWSEYNNNGWRRVVSKNKGLSNNIFDMPNQFSHLSNLEHIILGGDWKSKNFFWNRWRIKKLSVLAKLRKLKIINLSNNMIQGTIDLTSFKELISIYLNNNNINAVKILSPLNNLEEVYLSNNFLKNISFLNQCLQLKTIDIHSNNIYSLVDIRGVLKKIGINDSKWQKNTINVNGNPLTNPSLEIIAQGKEYVLAYFDQYDAEQSINLPHYENRDVKLILVGNSDVGKSTLAEFLVNNNCDTTLPSTHWMNVKTWNLSLKKNKYTIKLFDFGGQEYYHDTHYLFFTRHTAYILLWHQSSNMFGEIEIEQRQLDGSKITNTVQCYPLKYWLDSIDYHVRRRHMSEDERKIIEILFERDLDLTNRKTSKGEDLNRMIDYALNTSYSDDSLHVEIKDVSNVVIVQSKVDDIDEQDFLDEKSLKNSYNNIFGYTNISVKTKRRIDDFKNIIIELLEKLPIVNKKLLGTWGKIKDRIEVGEHGGKSITIDEFKSYCNETISTIPEVSKAPQRLIKDVLFSETDTRSFAQYLCNIGLILYFPESEKLKDTVFLNQNTIIDNIYNILLGLDKNKGKFNEAHVIKSLKKTEIDDECKEMINLMKHFKMIFEDPTNKGTFIAPLYLSQTPPKSISIFLSNFQKPICRFLFNGFIHKHVILEFFQKYGQDALNEKVNDTDFYFYWKNGIVIKDEHTQEIVMVKFCNANEVNECAYIDIYRWDNLSSKGFSLDIIRELERICTEKNVTKAVTIDGENFIPVPIIHEEEKKGNWLFHYNGKYYNLKDFKDYLQTPIKMKKVFISYSKIDAPYLQKLENHLSVLKRNGTIDTWNCRKLLAGEKWDGKIKKELEEADIIIFLVSDDFLATDYIWDIEIKRAIEREKENPDKIRVIPVIVRSCVWEASPLGIYNTAPRKAEVLANAKDIDEAYRNVVLAIQEVL